MTATYSKKICKNGQNTNNTKEYRHENNKVGHIVANNIWLFVRANSIIEFKYFQYAKISKSYLQFRNTLWPAGCQDKY